MSVSVPLKAALRGRCGVCSQGKLFEGSCQTNSNQSPFFANEQALGSD